MMLSWLDFWKLHINIIEEKEIEEIIQHKEIKKSGIPVSIP